MTISTRQQALLRNAALKRERSTWWHHWAEINRVLLPRTGQFFVTDANRGSRQNRRNEAILDNTASRALTTLGAGMQSGMTSPASPWIKLETSDPDLMNQAAVSIWLDKVTQRLLTIFQRSNTYRALHMLYEELGAYGTAGDVVLPDFDTVIHHYPLTVGEYCISANDKGKVDTLSREFQMTVAQIVNRYVYKNGKFDWSTTSPQVKNLWDAHQLDAWIPVCHLVQPRQDRDPGKFDSRNMAFESLTFETSANSDLFLSMSGYKRFPVLVPRWTVSGHDIYGSSCPGMMALGDVQQLQHEQLRKAQGIDYQTNPPLQVPSQLKNSDSDFLPGGITYVDQNQPHSGVRSAFEVQLDMSHLLLDIQDVRQRINGAFFSDLFLFLTSMGDMGGQKTAREIAEIHEEKLLMLGPVVENLQNDMLHPLVDITFDAAMEAGVLPPAPPELHGQELKVEFISMLAQAQRAVSMAGVDRIIGATASIAAAKQDPSVWDKIDTDQVIDKAAGYLGVDPQLIRGDDQVKQLREQRAQAQQQAQQAAVAEQASKTAKNLAGADMQGNNALTNVVRGYSGVEP